MCTERGLPCLGTASDTGTGFVSSTQAQNASASVKNSSVSSIPSTAMSDKGSATSGRTFNWRPSLVGIGAWNYRNSTPGMLDIHQIQTGRGNAACLVFPDGTTMLIDAGAVPDRPGPELAALVDAMVLNHHGWLDTTNAKAPRHDRKVTAKNPCGHHKITARPPYGLPLRSRGRLRFATLRSARPERLRTRQFWHSFRLRSNHLFKGRVDAI